jgi:hypothetical protein
MTNSYKQIQITNTALGDVAVDGFIPLGSVTRRINAPQSCCNTFTLSTTGADTLTISDAGFYKITYVLTATAAAAGEVTIALVTNGATVNSVSQAIVDETNSVNLSLIYTIRVFPNCNVNVTNCPVNVQMQNTGIALTGATSNLIVEKI